jgi:serralysin
VFRGIFRPALTVFAGAALVAGTGAGLTAAHAGQPADAGPPYEFTTVLRGQFAFTPLKNAAMIRVSRHGYTYYSGQQDGDLTITKDGDALRFHDKTARRFEELGNGCREVNVAKGVGALCDLPNGITEARPLLLEVWPRLGDDYTDGRTLPATIAMSVLGDAGDDVAHLGAGPDFFNGAFGRDRVTGGAGNDWLRTGDDADRIRGGAGNDYLMGVDGADRIRGGSGDDRIGGDRGRDRLYAGSGRDVLSCGAGRDGATVDGSDTARDCETLARR